jgi:hypothetical protein
MTEAQQIVTMAFGAAVAVAGIALMLFGRSESSRSHVKVLGMEFEISTPALAVFLVGSALFVLPHFLPRVVTPQFGPPTPTRSKESTTDDPAAEELTSSEKRATRIPEIAATIKRFDDRGGLLTLEMELVNESTVPPRPGSFITLLNAQLIDERSKASWRASHFGGNFLSNSLGGGQRATIWAKFDIAPSRPEFLTLDAEFLESPWENLRPNWVAATSK